MKFSIVVLIIVVFIAGYLISTYNKFIKEKNVVEEAFSTMDVYLKKRYDLIPNLVETVKGYANHESETLENVIKSRNNYSNSSSIDEKIANENNFSGVLGRLFALQESYPELKANENFKTLQKQLVEIENDIMQARKYYNGTTRNYNTICESFPNNIIANIFKFTKFPYFNVADPKEKENVKVAF